MTKKGILIAFEGPDGAGKSEQIELLRDFLDDHDVEYSTTKWNSSPFIGPAMKKLKKQRQFTPLTYSLAHATDFADRYQRTIEPNLKIGRVVIADRYIYTAFARDVARGNNISWVKGLYSYATAPDVTFYLRVTIDEALARVKAGREPKFYEAGMDLGLSPDLERSFTLFQSRIIAQYERLAKEYNFFTIDGSKSQKEIAKVVEKEVKRLCKIE